MTTVAIPQKIAPSLEVQLPDAPNDDSEASLWIREALLPFLMEELREHRRALNNVTSLNMSAHYETGITTPGTIDTTFSIAHNLNRIPEIVLWNVDTTGAMIYDQNRAGWTKTSLDLRCNLATVGLTVLVL